MILIMRITEILITGQSGMDSFLLPILGVITFDSVRNSVSSHFRAGKR